MSSIARAMAERFKPLLDRSFLWAEFNYEYLDFKDSADETALTTRLQAWSNRKLTGESEIEAAFIQRFFVDTWGYADAATGRSEWTLQQQFGVPGAGAGGAAGAADLALGYFGEGGTTIPQVVCEFKGVGADLDKPQARKGNTRSAVVQGLDYLRFARRGFLGNEPVLPRFALVTDTNEFRLYWWDRAPERFLRFRLKGADLFDRASLLSDTDEDRFDRFLFWRLLRPDMLLSAFGRPRIEALIGKQGTSERKLEKAFYGEYRDYRTRLYTVVRTHPGLDHLTAAGKLRLAQKVLDRLIFVMFAEDMGMRVAFPLNLLRDQLMRESLDRFYAPGGTRVWEILQIVFRTMNEGGEIDDMRVHRFNGGLFENDPDIDALRLPTSLFCAKGQGRNPASVEADKETLLYLAATYNFAAEGDANNSIGLYTLGHIFEQSIDDLEVLEAEAEGRESIAAIVGKRKREGVYYTPEPIVRRIVDETIGPLFRDWRKAAGWPANGDPVATAAEAYWARLQRLTVVDPACGSGAFLLTALQYVVREFQFVMETRRRLDANVALIEENGLIDLILSNNLHGVDINPASVEISKLSLWLHTARAEKPLSSLDGRIRHGNSLIGPEFDAWPGAADIDEETRERVAAFDWAAAWPDVHARGGFDAVIGNPPYVKLQNYARVYPETADYLRSAAGGTPVYASAQTGNTDLYLPFIERGLGLLGPEGRMGYIAPNLWPGNDYGAGLRTLVHAGGHLERWIDFRSHQVFEGLTTYTAIQVYSKARNAGVKVAFARDGDLGKVDWSDPAGIIPYGELPSTGDPWLIAPEPVRKLAGRLAAECRRLDDPAVTKSIYQGLITSADYVYHLKRLSPGRFLHTPPKEGNVQPPSFEVRIEDEIMKPLVSGRQAKRFIAPSTDTYILFPYAVDASGATLLTAAQMETRYLRAWSYLLRFEVELRAREGGDKFDDERWYRFGRDQNLDKQEIRKLVVAQTVPGMRVCYDQAGEYYLNNVRVNGIVPKRAGGFLLGVLNSPVVDLLFRWRGKPKANDYYEANKQFIAPLPVPNADAEQRAEVAAVAEGLQRGYTRRLSLVGKIADRLGATSRRKRPHEWLLPDVRPVADVQADVPRNMPPSQRPAWASARYAEEMNAAVDRVDRAIRLDSALDAELDEGELRFTVDGTPVARAFVAADMAPFLLAQWQVVALTFEANGKGDGKRLIDGLRGTAMTADAPVVGQIVGFQGELSRLTAELRGGEARLDDLTAALFGLSAAERALVRRANGGNDQPAPSAPRTTAANRRAILQAFGRTATAKAKPGPSAARSQDFLYDDDTGLPT